MIEAGDDDRKDPRVYDIYDYGDAFETSLDWSYPTDQGKSIRALVLYLLTTSGRLHGARWGNSPGPGPDSNFIFHSLAYRGKTLGGSSSINGAAWTRGLAAQYDAWNDLLDPADQGLGWDWSEIFSFMKRVCYLDGFEPRGAGYRDLEIDRSFVYPQAEAFSAPNSQQRAKGANSVAAYHGTAGPVQVTFPYVLT